MSGYKEKHSVLPAKYGSGPFGLGDPEDKTLRKVETEVMIPKKMRDIAKLEKCVDEVKSFSDCCRTSNLFMVFTCRKENTIMQDCLARWYQDEEFKKRCREEYLRERSEYRQTGATQTSKSSQRLPASM